MPMRSAHLAFASPLAITTTDLGLTVLSPHMDHFTIVPLAMGALVWYSCDWPDYDHPSASVNKDLGILSQAIGKIVRFVSWQVYLLTRTEKDKATYAKSRHKRGTRDAHRDFTHSVEGCGLFGAAVGACTYFLPFAGQFWPWFALATFIGCLSHVFADALTPSGVPWSFIYNRLRYGEAWKRHRFGKRGLFTTNSAAEKTWITPALYVLSALLLIAYSGLTVPLYLMLVGA